ncbi:hypothetical protein [Lacticaseibacillus saniviri]|uniref:hypothetical protein n=1 Tax=Lacticaseibacillus saniviri TaxID=931533 RepID=UPI0006D0290B|nr:hypothetical protein [Lacticaseibacillus saniviri]
MILAGSYGLNRFAPTANRQASEDVVHEELTADKPETSRLDVRVRKLEKSGTKKQKSNSSISTAKSLAERRVCYQVLSRKV